MFENPLPVMENETYTLKRTRLIIFKKTKKQINKRVCMFENSLPVIENAKSAIKHTRSKSPVSKNEKCVKHVCMFENPLPVMENETYTLKHTRLIIINKSKNASLRKRVCLKPICLSWKMQHTRSNIHA